MYYSWGTIYIVVLVSRILSPRMYTYYIPIGIHVLVGLHVQLTDTGGLMRFTGECLRVPKLVLAQILTVPKLISRSITHPYCRKWPYNGLETQHTPCL